MTNWPVVQQDPRGISPLVSFVDKVQVSEYPVQHERKGPDQSVRTELGNRLRRLGVKGVGNHRRGRHHRNHLIQQIWAILSQDPPVLGRIRSEQRQFMATLVQSKKQREPTSYKLKANY